MNTEQSNVVFLSMVVDVIALLDERYNDFGGHLYLLLCMLFKGHSKVDVHHHRNVVIPLFGPLELITKRPAFGLKPVKALAGPRVMRGSMLWEQGEKISSEGFLYIE